MRHIDSLVALTIVACACWAGRVAADNGTPYPSYRAVVLGTELGSERVSLIHHATGGEILRFRVRGSDDALPTLLRIGNDDVVERKTMSTADVKRLRDIILDPTTYVDLESREPLRDGEGRSSITLGGSSNRVAIRLWYKDHPSVLEVTYQLMGRVTFEEPERTLRGRASRAPDCELLLGQHGLQRLTALASSLLVGVVDTDAVEGSPKGRD